MTGSLQGMTGKRIQQRILHDRPGGKIEGGRPRER